MSDDRLDEIKAAFEARGWFLDMQHVAWLIAECERLRVADGILRAIAASDALDLDVDDRLWVFVDHNWVPVELDDAEIAYLKILAAAAALQEPHKGTYSLGGDNDGH